jgi:hypothetical protein
MHGGMFTPENGMSLGPRMQDEAALAAQVQRAALFSTFAKATDMESSLVRAVKPVVSVTRLVYSGHGQFSFRGHAIGLANGGMEVALNPEESLRKRDPSHLRPRGELPNRPCQRVRSAPQLAICLHVRG